MPDMTAPLAEVLRAHQWRTNLYGCTCGKRGRIGNYAAMAAHQAEAVVAAGLAVVQLPEPVDNWDGSMTAWPVQQSWRGEPYRDGEVNIRPSDGHIVANGVSNPCASPADARSLAAALLAAAAAAEAVKV